MRRSFEQRFEGKGNAGLRAQIRQCVTGLRCGPATERAVLALDERIALTAVGLDTLRAVAADYRRAHGEGLRASCDCFPCHANG